MASREERWEALYEALLVKLTACGRDTVDFLLVADDHGDYHQGVCISNPDFWSPEIEDAVRDVLAGGFPDWSVHVMFEDGSLRRALVVLAGGRVAGRSDTARRPAPLWPPKGKGDSDDR